MSSLSPRVGMTLMQDTDFVDPSIVAGNSQRMDTITSVTQSTSTSRPSTPFNGQWIYETDTQNVRRWSQSDGKWYLRGGSGVANAAGLTAQFSDGGSHLLAGTSGGVNFQTISLHDYNATLRNGHTYKIVEHGWFNLSGSPYQQNHGDDIFPEFFTIWGNGSNPALVDTSSLHYFRESYQQNVLQNQRPYYKTFHFTMGGSVGIGNTAQIYFRSCMRVDTSFYPTGCFLGRPSTTLTAKAYIYDLGILGVN